MKNTGKILYAIFKNKIHKGNAYGINKEEAILTHLQKAQLPICNKTINEYSIIEAVEKTHYFKSKDILEP